jgi:hypothetical protein
MKINIVTYSPLEWVLGMITENWCRHLPDCSISTKQPDHTADINFYVNWGTFKPEQKTKIDVGYFTHRENCRFDRSAAQMDYCIAMCEKTLSLLPPHKSSIVRNGIGEEYINQKSEVVFGIAGRDYHSGRKNFNVISELNSIPNSKFIKTGGRFSKSEMVEFYKCIDYLLVTATNEGGPVPVIEALTMGVPVIAPDVGWCWEYPVIKYKDFDELHAIVTSLCSFVDVDQVWKRSSEELLTIFKGLYEGSNKPH